MRYSKYDIGIDKSAEDTMEMEVYLIEVLEYIPSLSSVSLVFPDYSMVLMALVVLSPFFSSSLVLGSPRSLGIGTS